jgi:hypothetical protein
MIINVNFSNITFMSLFVAPCGQMPSAREGSRRILRAIASNLVYGGWTMKAARQQKLVFPLEISTATPYY